MPVINPSGDSVISQDNPTAAGGSNATIVVGELAGASSLRRSLIKFDLSAYAGKVVTSAILRLYDTGVDYTNNTRTMNIFRVRRAWTEAGVTWNKYDGTNNWTTAGAADTTNDIYSDVVGSVSLPNPPSAGYIEVPIGISYINTWLDGSITNNGFLLSIDTGADDAHEFNSKEAASNLPELVINLSSDFLAFL